MRVRKTPDQLKENCLKTAIYPYVTECARKRIKTDNTASLLVDELNKLAEPTFESMILVIHKHYKNAQDDDLKHGLFSLLKSNLHAQVVSTRPSHTSVALFLRQKHEREKALIEERIETLKLPPEQRSLLLRF